MDQNRKKKNREIIERGKKRQRDHFRHEAHKKPKKKIIKRDSIVYFTIRQTSLCGFISLLRRISNSKALVNTDLPELFPFTSSKGNSYIFCMYNYDSNVIWSVPIKSRNIIDLVIELKACYKVPAEADIIPIIH